MGNETFVVATGNAFDGLTLLGPFDTKEEALEYAKANIHRDMEWRVVGIEQSYAD
jgi:hypothetical protein